MVNRWLTNRGGEHGAFAHRMLYTHEYAYERVFLFLECISNCVVRIVTFNLLAVRLFLE